MARLTKNGTQYSTRLGAHDRSLADVVIGGDGPRFVPSLMAQKWNREAWLSISWPDPISLSNTEAWNPIGDGRVEIESGNIRHGYYPIRSEKAHIGDVIENEIIFAGRPASNSVVLNLSFSPGLSFYYQDRLTPQEEARRSHRPENVIDSYAVYFNKQHNLYTTGKFCHIFRWELIDADGNRTYVRRQRALTSAGRGELVIDLPAQFMDNARYPVTLKGVGDTYGFTDAATTLADATAGHTTICRPGSSLGETGTLTKLHGYTQAVTAADREIKLVLYDESGGSPNALIADSDAWYNVNTPRWHVCPDDVAFNSGSGAGLTDQNYYIGMIWESSDSDFYWDSGNGRVWDTSADDWPNPPNPYDGGDWGDAYWMGAYLEYTPAGVGVAPTAVLDGPLVGPLGGPI